MLTGQFTRGSWWPTGRTIGGRAELCVTRSFRFYIGRPNSPLYIEVPDGFVFDGASIPHWSRYFFPVGSIEIPAAIHDFVRQDRTIPLWLGDLIFLHAMLAYGTPKLASLVAYISVSFNKSRGQAR